jgi:plastocyanin
MRRLSVVAVLLLVVVSAACSGGGDDGSDVRGSGSASGSGTGSAAGSGSGTATTKTTATTSGPAAKNPASKIPVALAGSLTSVGNGKVSAGKVTVELEDYFFRPTFIQAKAGEKVTVTLRNKGAKTHTFTAKALDVDEVVKPGDSAKVTLTLPDKGAVEFLCRFHQAQGMRGAFYAKKGDKVAKG